LERRRLMRSQRVVFVLAFLALSAALGAVEDPLIGTWKLNLAKSMYNPGPPPQSAIVKYEPYGANGIKVTAEITDAQGKTTITEYSANFDGQDVPVIGNEDADTASVKRIDARITEVTNKKGGKTSTILRRVVSNDGKALTITTKGTNARGQRVNNVAIFEKQ
jgi:hypothetical protein